jgi:hypothetical protein
MERISMRKLLTLLAVTLAAISLGTTVSASAATAPYCGIRWGSLPKEHDATRTAHLVNVRAGPHDCFDRLVVDLDGKADGYRVRYVSQVAQDGSGTVIPLRGGARLQIIVVAPAYNDDYRPTYEPANPNELRNVSGWSTFRQIAWAGSFEGQTTIGLGVRARLPFRVFTLDGPSDGSRIVVDVAHRW